MLKTIQTLAHSLVCPYLQPSNHAHVVLSVSMYQLAGRCVLTGRFREQCVRRRLRHCAPVRGGTKPHLEAPPQPRCLRVSTLTMVTQDVRPDKPTRLISVSSRVSYDSGRLVKHNELNATSRRLSSINRSASCASRRSLKAGDNII